MKIAVASENKQVTEHFGHCPEFMLFTITDGAISQTETVPNPGHKPGFLPNFLADRGVEVIIAGGMGQGAVDIFQQRGVEVIMGASGDAQAAVTAYLSGSLASSGSICHQHQHAGECGEH